MNYKLEKFWNIGRDTKSMDGFGMNYKLEKFWNVYGGEKIWQEEVWTINLKSFEIRIRKRGYFG